MFVIEALVLTFMTTPLTLLVYPPKYRTLHSGAKARVDQETQETQTKTVAPPLAEQIEGLIRKSRIAVMLQKLEHISPLMTITQLLGPSLASRLELVPSKAAALSGSASQASNTITQSNIDTPKKTKSPSPTLDALRLMDLSDRTSAVMYGSMTTELLQRDSLVAALRTFARLHQIPVTTATLCVIPQEEFPNRICERAEEVAADLVLLPWNTSLHPVVETVPSARHGEGSSYNPFDGLFAKSSNPSNDSTERSGTVGYAQFVRKVFAISPVDVALFLESDGSGTPNVSETEHEHEPLVSGQHIFFPYFGGPDDRLALDLVIQICGNADGAVRATIVRLTKTEPDMNTSADGSKLPSTGQNEAMNLLTVQSVSITLNINRCLLRQFRQRACFLTPSTVPRVPNTG